MRDLPSQVAALTVLDCLNTEIAGLDFALVMDEVYVQFLYDISFCGCTDLTNA
jgi:hypothetical protein